MGVGRGLGSDCCEGTTQSLLFTREGGEAGDAQPGPSNR